jgi:hypothetical protein
VQSFGFMFAIIAAFVLPHLEIFQFVNFAPVSPVLSGVGIIMTAAGMVLLVWARQTLGRNWSQTVSAKEGHELIRPVPLCSPSGVYGRPDRMPRLRDRRRWWFRFSAPIQRVQLAFSRQWQPGAAMINDRDEVRSSAEAE